MRTFSEATMAAEMVAINSWNSSPTRPPMNRKGSNAAKLLDNFLTVGLRALVLLAFQSARRHGIDWSDLYRLASQGAASSRTLDTMVRGALDGDYRGNTFSLANCLKDMSYAEVMLADDPDGRRMQQAMAELFRRYVDAGFGDRFASETLDPEVVAKASGSG